jgi:AraC-like DNA-binding protein
VAAALLAAPGRRILAVALDCGFASQSAFNRAFRREYRSSPRAWRSAILSGGAGADARAAMGTRTGTPARRR